MTLDFDKDTYNKFLSDNKTVYNTRIRSDDETFFDAMVSKEADLRTTLEGKKIITYIQAIGNS